jgi:hypothetical protein
MLKIRAFSPELAVAIEEGRMTLKEAAAQIQKHLSDSNQTKGEKSSEKPERPPEITKIQRAAKRAIQAS